MKSIPTLTLGALCTATLLQLSGCAGMSESEKNTAIGAGVGAVGGSILSGGGALGTLGGAAVGGVIGHELSKNKEKDRN
jgi:osmotically inducible lipoprotein OsmB